MLNEDTQPKTLWSQTQFDLLYIALSRSKPDIFIKEIMVDLNRRGFPPEYVLPRVRKKLGMVAYNRIKLILRKPRS
ncbi:MAG: hypothetical protein GWP74_05920 [Proteobacteria bacterium]|nr:hypothetical protein [Pseudomonadota bacterium]